VASRNLGRFATAADGAGESPARGRGVRSGPRRPPSKSGGVSYARCLKAAPAPGDGPRHESAGSGRVAAAPPWRGGAFRLPDRPTWCSSSRAVPDAAAKSIGDATRSWRSGWDDARKPSHVTFGNGGLILGISALARATSTGEGSLTAASCEPAARRGRPSSPGDPFPRSASIAPRRAHVSTLFLAVVALRPHHAGHGGQAPRQGTSFRGDLGRPHRHVRALAAFQLPRTWGCSTRRERPHASRTPAERPPRAGRTGARAPAAVDVRVALTLSASATAIASELLVGALKARCRRCTCRRPSSGGDRGRHRERG